VTELSYLYRLFLVYINVCVSGFSIPDCHISNVLFLCMSMSVSLDCPLKIQRHWHWYTQEKDVRDRTMQRHWHWYTQEKDVRDVTISNGQPRLVYINVCVSRLSIPDCLLSIVFFLCISMSVSLGCPFLIVTSLTSFSCVYQCQCL
jgi:hypothetical protein